MPIPTIHDSENRNDTKGTFAKSVLLEETDKKYIIDRLSFKWKSYYSKNMLALDCVCTLYIPQLTV